MSGLSKEKTVLLVSGGRTVSVASAQRLLADRCAGPQTVAPSFAFCSGLYICV